MTLGRKARRVRLHLLDGKGQPGETVEGIELRRRPVDGFHVLVAAKHLEGEDRSHALEGQIEIHRDRVLMRQVLT